jgi:hypothetical protein
MAAWEKLFEIGGLGVGEDLDAEVDPTLFHNPEHDLSQFIL